MSVEFRSEDHSYWRRGRRVPSVTQVIDASGLIDRRFFTEESRVRGSLIHQIVLMEANKTLDEDSVDPRPEIAGRYLAWKKFRKESGYSPLYTEHLVYSPSFDYAGQFDSLGWLNGRTVLLDIKTGDVPSWVPLQLAGYSFALVECGLPKPLRLYALQLKQNGCYQLHPVKDEITARAEFFHCLNKTRGLVA